MMNTHFWVMVRVLLTSSFICKYFVSVLKLTTKFCSLKLWNGESLDLTLFSGTM